MSMLHCKSHLAFCLLVLFLPAISSCRSEADEGQLPEGQCTVTFSVTNYRQVSFDDLSASAETRAIPTNHPSTLAHLLVAVFDAETGEMACPVQQHDYADYEREDQWNDYPKFSLTLPYGRYRMLALGFNGSQSCQITSERQIAWTNDYVPNTFLHYEELSLDANSVQEKQVTLRHVVAAFRITTEDAMPATLQKMRFGSTVGGTVLDATTGFAASNIGRTSEIAVPDTYRGKAGIPLTVYLFLPGEETSGNYTVEALGQDDAVLFEKHFTDVPLRINYLTEWQGNFFSTSSPVEGKGTIGFSWDTQWADTIRLR